MRAENYPRQRNRVLMFLLVLPPCGHVAIGVLVQLMAHKQGHAIKLQTVKAAYLRQQFHNLVIMFPPVLRIHGLAEIGAPALFQEYKLAVVLKLLIVLM